MAVISDALLEDVVLCNKVATRAERRRLTFSNRHRKNTLYLSSEDGKYEYKVFLRQSEDFIEDFSVGLIWTNPNRFIEIPKNSVILLRCQGPHDGKAPLGADIHHDYHIHKITLDDFREKRYQKPSGWESTVAFSSFEQAIFYFISTYHIKNVDRVIELPEKVTQISLF